MTSRKHIDMWRLELWNYMLDHIPAKVIMNLDVGYYSVIDNSNQYIYADDLDENIYDQIVKELGRILYSKGEETFYNMFCLDYVNERKQLGRQKINLIVWRIHSSCVQNRLHVRLVFRRHSNESEMEFQFFQQ